MKDVAIVFGVIALIVQDVQKFVVIPDFALNVFTMVDTVILYVLLLLSKKPSMFF